MKHVVIELTKPRKVAPLSWLIRIITDAEYSHIRFSWEKLDRTIIYEASGSHVRFLGTFVQKDYEVRVVNSFDLVLTDEEFDKLEGVCIDFAYTKYGLWQLIGMGLQKVLGLSGNPFPNGKRAVVCSELVARVLHAAKGWSIPKPMDQVEPKDIEVFLEILSEDPSSGLTSQ